MIGPDIVQRERETRELHGRKLVLDHDEIPKPGEFLWRRIPGTLALAMTNLLAAGLLLDSSVFDTSAVLIIARTVMSANMWGALFLLSGVTLLVATVNRKLLWLNIGSTISLFSWIAISLAGIMAWFFGEVELSPIAGGLFFWMMAGQAAMLVVPLIGRRGRE